MIYFYSCDWLVLNLKCAVDHVCVGGGGCIVVAERKNERKNIFSYFSSTKTFHWDYYSVSLYLL